VTPSCRFAQATVDGTGIAAQKVMRWRSFAPIRPASTARQTRCIPNSAEVEIDLRGGDE
jgi:hypothetical protein